MFDVKELFTPSRRRILRGEPEVKSAAYQCQGLPRSWRRFPDPAADSLLQSRACHAWEVLGTCGASLMLCHKDLRSSRDALRQCRTQLEAHLACSAAVCDLLTGRWSDPQDDDWVSDTISKRPKAASCARHCIGRVRCFFCRERDSLEHGLDGLGSKADWELDSAVLADVSCTASDSSDGFHFAHVVSEGEDRDSGDEHALSSRRLVRRRKTSRERGRPLYKLKGKKEAESIGSLAKVSKVSTWYATHTVAVEPPRMAHVHAQDHLSAHSARSGRSAQSAQSVKDSPQSMGSGAREPQAIEAGKIAATPLKVGALKPASQVASENVSRSKAGAFSAVSSSLLFSLTAARGVGKGNSAFGTPRQLAKPFDRFV